MLDTLVAFVMVEKFICFSALYKALFINKKAKVVQIPAFNR